MVTKRKEREGFADKFHDSIAKFFDSGYTTMLEDSKANLEGQKKRIVQRGGTYYG
jgi:hypothetical protein